jgi:predicted acylesterase/phospholipase RssA
MQQPMDSPHPTDFPRSGPRRLPGQIVLVLQGGGALGSYQAGVHQALQGAGIEPDWIIGASIGAISVSLIAGNEPQRQLARLNEFWAYWTTLTRGIPVSSRRMRRRMSATASLSVPSRRLLLDRATGAHARRDRRLRSDQSRKASPEA